MPFKFQKLDFPGVVLIEAETFNDNRGYFLETYKRDDFKEAGIDVNILQVDHSRSEKNVIRGMHYQKLPMAQAKIIDVINGEIFDVVVDLRNGSPSYGKWLGMHLGGKTRQMLFVPEGFAHGFCAISETAEIVYYCTQVYAPEHQRGILWSDPQINISWPVKNPIVSEKDINLSLFNKADHNFTYQNDEE